MRNVNANKKVGSSKADITKVFHLQADSDRAKVLSALAIKVGKPIAVDVLKKKTGNDRDRVIGAVGILDWKTKAKKLPYKIVRTGAGKMAAVALKRA